MDSWGPETWSASFGTASKPTQKETSPYQGMSADAAERWSESAHNHETHNQVLNQIRETEQSVPGDYDSYIVAQTLRRKTNDKYRGGSFEIFTGWKNGWP